MEEEEDAKTPDLPHHHHDSSVPAPPEENVESHEVSRRCLSVHFEVIEEEGETDGQSLETPHSQSSGSGPELEEDIENCEVPDKNGREFNRDWERTNKLSLELY